MKAAPFIGQKLYAKLHASRGAPPRFEWFTVTSVRRKFFECTNENNWKQDFYISSWTRTGDNAHHNFPIYLYESEQECRDEERASKLARSLSNTLRYTGDWDKLTLDQLEKITEIVYQPPTNPAPKHEP